MKKLTLILMAFVLFAAACNKDDEDNQEPDALAPTAAQKGFCIEYTSTTCGICGAQGEPLIHKFAKEAPNGVMIALHVNANSDSMANNQLWYRFNDDRPCGSGIPSFWVGDDHITLSDQDAMKNLLAKGNAIAGIDIRYSKEGNNMKVETLTKFFSAGTGEYYLSVYILEDGIDGSKNAPAGYKQAGASYSHPNDDYKHDYVLRAASVNNIKGEKIVTNPAAGKEISKSYTIPLKPSWKQKLYAVAVLWKYDPNANTTKYTYVNSIRK